MKVSLNWIRFINEKYRTAAEPAPHGVEKLVEKIGAQLGAVDEVIDVGQKYQGILIVKVVSVQQHPNADKLTVCLIDDGRLAKKVSRNKDGLVQIVCGAPNVKVGMLAVWIPPGVKVPSSDETEAFVMETREIRGAASNGMLASPSELAISEGHEGLLEVDEPAKAGMSFAEVYKLNDYIIDIENKMFTHRPDLFGQLGVAREIAGIQHQVFKSPEWYKQNVSIATDGRSNGLKLKVNNESPKLVPRFCIVAIKDVRVEPSPIWLQTQLSRVGARPINNIVDITNFFMLETAQPLHAYDYDKLKALEKSQTVTIKVRPAKAGEKLTLLGGETIELEKDTLVIANSSQPLGLAGVKGGADTEVDANTKTIVLECGTFDMTAVRHSARTYGIFSEAVTRFTKGQSPLQNMAVLTKTVDDIKRIAGGRLASKVYDEKTPGLDKQQKPVVISQQFINSRLGLELTSAESKRLLENVEFAVSLKADNLTVTPPFWRTDIEIAEDIVEEVGRLYGYDKLPLKLPRRDLTPAERNLMISFKNQLREILDRAGTNEILTYSFVHGSLLEKVGQNPAKSYRLRNALSPNLQYYRQTLTPSLLEKVQPNIKLGFEQFAMFEIGKGHVKSMLDEEKLPKELEQVSVVVASKQKLTDAAYFAARAMCQFLLAEVGAEEISYEPINVDGKSEYLTYYEPNRSADIKVKGQMIGRVGEYKAEVASSLKLPAYCGGFELDISKLMEFAAPPKYLPLNRYPDIEQDICLRSSTDISYARLTAFLKNQLDAVAKTDGYIYKITPLDIFQRPNDPAHKQTTWRIALSHPQRTLTTAEMNRLLDDIAAAAKRELKAERI